MRFLSKIAALPICLMLAQAAPADVKNFAFKGEIISVRDDRAEFDGSIFDRTPIEGFYIFTTTAISTNPDPTVGDFRYNDPTNMLVVKVGNYVFRSNPKKTDLLIETVNRPGGDNYLIRSYYNVCSQPLGVEHMAWQLDDYSGTALTDATLPTTPPVLSAWQSIGGLTIEGGSGSYYLRARITEIIEIPVIIPTLPPVSIQSAIELKWQSEIGYFYQIQSSDDFHTWIDLGQPVLGDGTELSKFFPMGSDQKKFYRAVITNHIP